MPEPPTLSELELRILRSPEMMASLHEGIAAGARGEWGPRGWTDWFSDETLGCCTTAPLVKNARAADTGGAM